MVIILKRFPALFLYRKPDSIAVPAFYPDFCDSLLNLSIP